MLTEHILQTVDRPGFQCAFMIKNCKTGEWASYNESALVSAASLIKIPIMVEIFRQVRSGKLSLRQRIEVKEADKVPYSILAMLEAGNQYTINDLITLMIVLSDNTAANRLIDIAGFEAINDQIRCLNLKNTILRRKMMDWQAKKAGRDNVTSAEDMVRLLELIYQGAVIDEVSSAYMLEIMKQQLDRSMMRLYIPDKTVIAHKTGELEGVAHDAGIVFHESGDFILVVFTWDAADNLLARQFIGQIASVVYEYFTEKIR